MKAYLSLPGQKPASVTPRSSGVPTPVSSPARWHHCTKTLWAAGPKLVRAQSGLGRELSGRRLARRNVC